MGLSCRGERNNTGIFQGTQPPESRVAQVLGTCASVECRDVMMASGKFHAIECLRIGAVIHVMANPTKTIRRHQSMMNEGRRVKYAKLSDGNEWGQPHSHVSSNGERTDTAKYTVEVDYPSAFRTSLIMKHVF